MQQTTRAAGWALRCVVILGVVAGTPLVSSGQEHQQDGVHWTEDFAEARDRAAKENKHLFLNFTGSDWCRYCVWMEKQIFSTDEFKQYADENLVCVTLDFPSQAEQDEAIKKQNKALQEKHEVRGFPTYLVLNPEGETVARLSTTSWAWRFVEKLDAKINPADHQVEAEWLTDGNFNDDITSAAAIAGRSGLATLHFLDNSIYASFPRDLDREIFQSTLFKRFADQNLVLVRSPMSTMFAPVDTLSDEHKQKLLNYAQDRYGKSEQELTKEELDACCFSDEEYQLREKYGVTRATLPAIAVLDRDGKAIKILKNDELSKLYNADGAKALIDVIQLSVVQAKKKDK